MPSSELDERVRISEGKVRDLSYDMEDAVDAFMMSVEEKQIYDMNIEQTSAARKDSERSSRRPLDCSVRARPSIGSLATLKMLSTLLRS